DVFVQLDHMASGSENLDPTQFFDPIDQANAVTKLVNAYDTSPYVPVDPKHHQIQMHIVAGNVIQEPTCTDVTTTPPVLCPYPNQAGVVGWKGGLVLLKHQS